MASEDADDVIDTIRTLTTRFQTAHFSSTAANQGLDEGDRKELARDLRTMEALTSASGDIILNRPSEFAREVFLYWLERL